MPYPVARKEEIPGDKKEQRDGSDESRKVGVWVKRTRPRWATWTETGISSSKGHSEEHCKSCRNHVNVII